MKPKLGHAKPGVQSAKATAPMPNRFTASGEYLRTPRGDAGQAFFTFQAAFMSSGVKGSGITPSEA